MWKQLIPHTTSRRRESTTVDLRVQLNKALEHGRMIEALEIYERVTRVAERRLQRQRRVETQLGVLLAHGAHGGSAP